MARPRSARKQILFVDDEKASHVYGNVAAREHARRHAFSPDEAMKVISRRVRAIEEVQAQKRRQRDAASKYLQSRAALQENPSKN